MTERIFFSLQETAAKLGIEPGELLVLVNAHEIHGLDTSDRVRKIPFRYDQQDMDTLRFEQCDIDKYNDGDTVASFAHRVGDHATHVRWAIDAGYIRTTRHEPSGRDARIYIARVDLKDAVKGFRRWRKKIDRSMIEDQAQKRTAKTMQPKGVGARLGARVGAKSKGPAAQG